MAGLDLFCQRRRTIFKLTKYGYSVNGLGLAYFLLPKHLAKQQSTIHLPTKIETKLVSVSQSNVFTPLSYFILSAISAIF